MLNKTGCSIKVFDEDVERAGWTRLRLETGFQSLGHIIVIGGVLWDSSDREFLKAAVVVLGANQSVFVFNLDDVHSKTPLRVFMPDVPLPTTTPVVAEYEESSLLRAAAGSGAFTLLDVWRENINAMS